MVKDVFAAVMSGAMLLAISNANAAPPGLSGKYFTNTATTCQPSIQVTYTGGSASSINVTSAGSTQSSITVAKFDPAKQKVTLNGVSNQGSALLLSDNIGHSFGAPFASGAVDVKFAFSNTDTTVTINGVVFQAIYGAVKNGVAGRFMLEGIDSDGCSLSVNASR